MFGSRFTRTANVNAEDGTPKTERRRRNTEGGTQKAEHRRRNTEPKLNTNGEERSEKSEVQ
jgi:hypothetical protein